MKQELPAFLQMAAAFSDPIFHSFYYMQYVILAPNDRHGLTR